MSNKLMAMMDVLVIDKLNKLYGDPDKPTVHAVKDLSMTVRKGEIIALLGSSGCGKTSTLRMIAGLESVSSGSILLAGKHIESLPPSQRGVAMAFEGYSLYPPLTVRDNIAFALKAQKLSPEVAAKRVADAAKLVDIESVLDRYPSSISGGQQQRASLARALVREANLYLLDEPMGQLEPQLRAVLRGRIKSRLNDNAMTAIFVTHDQTEANALADRIAVMEGGVLQQFASQKDLKDKPANLFVATFIGEPPMNVFDAGVTRAGDRISLTLANGPSIDFAAGDITAPVLNAIGSRSKITLGLRPQSVSLSRGALQGRVTSNQWLGDQTHIAAEFAGKTLVAVTPSRVAARPGDEISLSFAASDMHLFDHDSGLAIAHGREAA
jgi:multiple sugar transport system ATP-binding protein